MKTHQPWLEIDEYWLNVWINTKDGSLVSELMFFSRG